MKIPRLLMLTAALAFSLGGSLHAAVVINEINYRPAGIPENPKGEFIELRNTGALSVNIGGWQFTKGVAFTFAAGTTSYTSVVTNTTSSVTLVLGCRNLKGEPYALPSSGAEAAAAERRISSWVCSAT